jgi:hypothetical protein
MGFEITYYYKEATEVAGTYEEEVLMKTSKIGKFDEDVSLDILAGKIMAQLARRNILIVDIEIFEYTKKKINYKETDSGILIKNKKFSFDSGAMVTATSEEDEELTSILENKELLEKIKKAIGPIEHTQAANQTGLKNLASRNSASKTENKRALRLEIYDPELRAKMTVEQKGYKFTSGKKYPIYSEKKSISGIGLPNYLTKDDSGREVEISSECFVVPPVGLSFEDSEPQYFGAAKTDVNLWQNVSTEDNVPDIRSR